LLSLTFTVLSYSIIESVDSICSSSADMQHMLIQTNFQMWLYILQMTDVAVHFMCGGENICVHSLCVGIGVCIASIC